MGSLSYSYSTGEIEAKMLIIEIRMILRERVVLPIKLANTSGLEHIGTRL